MKSNIYHILLSLFVTLHIVACSDSSVPDDSVALISDSDTTTFFLVSRFTKDTVVTNSLLSPIDSGTYNYKGLEFIENSKPYNQSQQSVYTNKSELIKNGAKVFYADSLVPFLEGERTELLPPKKVEYRVVNNRVAEPGQKAMLPWIYRDATQFDIQNLTTDQGLPSNNVNCLMKDSRGIMWIGTDKGLVAFDGSFVKVYNKTTGLLDENITALAEDSNGNLWLGTEASGFVKYNGRTFEHFSLDSIQANQPVSHLYVDEKDEVWGIIMFGGVFHFDGNELTSYREDQGMLTYRPITSITFNPDGSKWVTGFGVGLYKIDKNGVGTTKGTSTYINSGFLDSKGRFWMAYWGTSIPYIYKDSLYDVRINSKYDTGLMLDVQEDSKGRIWALSYSAGIFMLDGDQVYNFGKREGVGYDYTPNFYIDEQDVVWLATSGGGVSRIDAASFSVTNSYSGLLSDYVFEARQSPNGMKVYGTEKGINIIKDSILLHPDDVLAHNGYHHYFNNAITDVLIDGEDIWATASNQGILLFRNKKVAVLGSSMVGGFTNPTAIEKDKYGNIWVGSAIEGIIRIHGDSLWNYKGETGIAYATVVDLLYDSNDNLWIGSDNQGLAKSNAEGLIYYTTNEGLISNHVNQIYEDNFGIVWISSDKGISYIENDSIKTIDSDNPFFTQNISSIKQDELNRYWIASEKGMVVLVPENPVQETWKLANYHVEVFDKLNGLLNDAFIGSSMLIDSEGFISVGTKGGLLTWSSKDTFATFEAPVVSIQSVSVNGIILDASFESNSGISFDSTSFENFNKYPENLKLSHDNNNIVIDYSGIYWKDPKRLSYSYFLEGYDEDWCIGGTENKATYKNLEYGKYQFHVKCGILDGVQSKEVVFEFEVLRPWWHTWIARIIFIGLAAMMVFLLIRVRTKQLKKRQEELELEVKTATSEIRQQKDEIEIAHTEIKDSIAYAKRIQSAILPSRKLVKEYIPNSFILYKPKDVVAGDFYWMEPLKDRILFAAADCTGHGVPGAMVSVICNNGLNRAVREFGITDPGLILDKTREILIEEFDKSDEDVRDGMDIALCSLETTSVGEETAILKYAGANNPLWIIRKGATTIEEIKSTKQPIGRYEKSSAFTTHTVELNAGDSFYIFSDGFSDQFGGERGKKFKGSQFKELLLSIQNEDLTEQAELIDEAFESWRGSIEQVDDVCVIGIRI